jgi:uncharacterized protein YggE
MNHARIVWAALSTCLFTGALAADDETPKRPFISVTGEAEVRVAPDQAVFKTRVVTQDKDLATAKAQNDTRVKAVLDLLHDLKIKPEKIQTGALYMSRRESYKDDRKTLGYYLAKSLVVVLDDVNKADEVLATFVKAGISDVDSYELRSSELRKYRDQARAMAIRAAKEKATAMTAEIGQTIGKAFSIREEPVDVPTTAFRPNFQGNAMQNAIAIGGGEPPEESEGAFSAGQISVRAKVTVSFDLP